MGEPHRHAARHRPHGVAVLLERAFGPGSTLTRIKDWAERQFEIDAVDAAELSLQLHGTNDRPDEATQLDELIEGSDRIVVLLGGRVVGEVSAAEATNDRLGLLMTGQDVA